MTGTIITPALLQMISEPSNEVAGIKLHHKEGRWEAAYEMAYGITMASGPQDTAQEALDQLVSIHLPHLA